GSSDPRHIRARANCICATAGRDDRSGIHRGHEFDRDRPRGALAPRAVTLAAAFLAQGFRRLAFRTLSSTAIHDRGSLLSEGHAGGIHGGDRLPWVRLESSHHDPDNFAPLTSLDWQVHVYGRAAPEIRVLCDQRHLMLHETSGT